MRARGWRRAPWRWSGEGRGNDRRFPVITYTFVWKTCKRLQFSEKNDPQEDTVSSRVSEFTRTAVTKYHLLGGFSYRYLVSYMVPEAGNTRSRCWQGWYLGQAVRGGAMPGLPPQLIDGYLPPVSSHGLTSCVSVSAPTFPQFLRVPVRTD